MNQTTIFIYLLCSTVASISGITAITASALLEQNQALLFSRIFFGFIFFIAIYAIVDNVDNGNE